MACLIIEIFLLLLLDVVSVFRHYLLKSSEDLRGFRRPESREFRLSKPNTNLIFGVLGIEEKEFSDTFLRTN